MVIYLFYRHHHFYNICILGEQSSKKPQSDSWFTSVLMAVFVSLLHLTAEAEKYGSENTLIGDSSVLIYSKCEHKVCYLHAVKVLNVYRVCYCFWDIAIKIKANGLQLLRCWKHMETQHLTCFDHRWGMLQFDLAEDKPELQTRHFRNCVSCACHETRPC